MFDQLAPARRGRGVVGNCVGPALLKEKVRGASLSVSRVTNTVYTDNLKYTYHFVLSNTFHICITRGEKIHGTVETE